MEIQVFVHGRRNSQGFRGAVMEKVRTALDHFGQQVRTVVLKFSDVNAWRGGVDKQLVMLVKLTNGETVQVKAQEEQWFSSLDSGLDKALSRLRKVVTKKRSSLRLLRRQAALVLDEGAALA